MSEDLKKIEAYLQNVPTVKRAALETLRLQIKHMVPQASEYFTYGMPAFKLSKGLAAYAAGKNHCALYPMSSNIVCQFDYELQAYKTSIGAIQFSPEKPIPLALLARIIQARIDEINAV